MAFTLDLIKPGEGEATRYSLDDGSYLVGRGASCALQLPDPDISERHALLLLRGRKARLEDLHSANGTYLNGNPVDGLVDVPPDAIIQIGGNMMRISPAEEAAETEAPPAEGPRSRAADEVGAVVEAVARGFAFAGLDEVEGKGHLTAPCSVRSGASG